MAVSSVRLFGPALLTDTAASLCAIGANLICKDVEFHFTNTDIALSIGVDIYLVPTAGTAGDSTTFLKSVGANAFILGPGETRTWSTEQVLIPGDVVQGKASTTGKIACVVSGRKVTQGV